MYKRGEKRWHRGGGGGGDSVHGNADKPFLTNYKHPRMELKK